MKRGRGGDSVEAIRAIWMEGYNTGYRAGLTLARSNRIPEVEITTHDLNRVYERGSCGNAECQVCVPRASHPIGKGADGD